MARKFLVVLVSSCALFAAPSAAAACSRQSSSVYVVLSSAKYPQTTDHILDAQAAGFAALLHIDRADEDLHRSVHGGPEKAVYAYAREDSDWWSDVLGIEIPDGMFGENLTLEGIDVSGAVIGERWRAGTVELEVCQPRLPCSKLGLRFGDLRMVKAFARASRPGAYLRIIAEGELAAGDEVTVLSRPEHGVTLSLVSDAILVDRSLAARALAATGLSEELVAELRSDAA